MWVVQDQRYCLLWSGTMQIPGLSISCRSVLYGRREILFSRIDASSTAQKYEQITRILL